MTTEWLAARLEEARLVVVDCRFRLGEPAAGHALYEGGHIPGAVFLDLDADLSGPPSPAGATSDAPPARAGEGGRIGGVGPVGGRHPLPDLDRFASALRRVGIGTGATVVAYDDGMTGGAARLWWLLRHVGFDDVAVLEGGIAAWDGPLGNGSEPTPAPGDFVLDPARVRHDDLVTAERIAADLQRPEPRRALLVLDARAPERFRGEVEPVDPVAGHIPGARNLPIGTAFPPPADLARTARTLVASCGSGVAAAGLVLALTAAGRTDVKLYAGSWSDWAARGLAVARGEDERHDGG